MIGIIGAMACETEGLAAAMTERREETVSGIKYIFGSLCGREVVLATCGIGKVFAAICAQTMILKYKPSLIINSGVAGALDADLSVMDAVVATSVVQHDMDTSPLGDPRGLISGINRIYFEADEVASQTLLDAARAVGACAVRGTVASGDAFIATPERKRDIADAFGAVACEMEGAAIGHVAYVNGIPFAVMRTISDGRGEVMDYRTFSERAAARAVEIIKKFLVL